jgi:hypothetical protein
MADSLTRQETFNDSFGTWFDGQLKPTIDDNRRRYAMEVEDIEERTELGLSSFASTKSTSVVDRAVERAIMEYHGEEGAISFTAKNAGDKNMDFLAAIHTENFRIRSGFGYFNFPTWNAVSLTAGFVDGIEAAMVSWKKESYTDKRTAYSRIDLQTGQPVEISKEEYEEQQIFMPEIFFEEEVEEEVPVVDTWWIDQLLPGENVLWDPKAPLLDADKGQCCLVKVERTIDQILEMGAMGVIDKITREELEEYQDAEQGDDFESDDSPDLDEWNTVEMWIWFEKKDALWHVEFSIEGKLSLSEAKNINDAWYNGRKVNRLPVVIGTSKLKPFQPVGRGIPESIAPIEDEYIQLRNLGVDRAKQDVEGRWRVSPGSDIDVNALVNSPVVRFDQGEAEKFDNVSNSNGLNQQIGALVGDINELAPVGMESSQITPSGADKTLGAIQLALGSSNEKLSVGLMVRNITLMTPVLYLISELTIAFETDENVLKLAEARAGSKREHKGQKLPRTAQGQGQGMINLKAIDVPLNIQINAGLGSVPRQQKLQYMQFLGQVGKTLGVPLDGLKMFQQGSVLLGFGEDQFISEQTPTPKGPEMKADIKIDFDRLPPEMQIQLLKMFASKSESMDLSFTGDGNLPKADGLPALQSSQPMQGAVDPMGGQNVQG